jgi:DNA-binding beta-propeller fold protein YncE
MTTTAFRLKYLTNVGFIGDQGGRAFQHPACIVRRSDGRIFVGSRGAAAAPTVGIQMVSVDHEFFGTVGEVGTREGQMLEPSALALDSDENLYLADEKLHRISIFDKNGEAVGSWGTHGSDPGEFNRPAGLLVQGETVLVVDSMNHRVQKYTTDGRYLDQWGSQGSGEGEFRLPWGITDDKDGNIYVADWGNDRIQKLTPDGQHLATIGESGDGQDQLNRPADVAVDPEGNLYIADWGNQRLQVLDASGKFLDSKRGEADLNPWVLEYFEAQQDEKRARQSYVPVYDVDTDDVNEISARIEPYFWDPCAVTLDDEGRVYVLETCRHRFQVFERV